MSETGSYVDEAVVRGIIRNNATDELPDAIEAARDLDEAYAARLLEITDPDKEARISPNLALRVKRELKAREATGFWETPEGQDKADDSLKRFFDGELHLGNMIDRQDQTAQQLDDITTFIRAVKMLASVFTGNVGGAEEEGGATEPASDTGNPNTAADISEPDASPLKAPPVASVFGGDGPDEVEQAAPEAPITINILGGEKDAVDDLGVRVLDDPDEAQVVQVDPDVANQIQISETIDRSAAGEAGDVGAGEYQEGEAEDSRAVVVKPEDFDPASEVGNRDGDVTRADEVEASDDVAASADSAGSGGDDGGEPPDEAPPVSEPEPDPERREKIEALLKNTVTRDLSAHYFPGVDDADAYEQSAAYLAFRDEMKQAWQAQADTLGLDPDGWDTISAKALNFWKQISHNPKSGKPGDSEYFEEGLSHLWITIDENLGDNISAEDRNALARTSIEVMAAQINDNRVHAIRDYKDGTNYFFEGDDINVDSVESGVGQIRAERAEQEAKAAASKAKEQADQEKRLDSIIEKYAKKGEVPDEVFKKTLTTLLDETLVDLPSEYAKFESHAKSEAYLKRHAEITDAFVKLATENGWTVEGDYELVATNILKTWFDAEAGKNEGRRIHPDLMTDSLVNLYESIQSQFPVNEPDLLARATVGRLVEVLNSEKNARKFAGEIDFEDIESAIVQSRIDKQIADDERIRAENETIQASLREQFSQELNNLSGKFQVLGPQRLKAIRNKIALNTALPEDQQAELQTLLNSDLKTVFGDDETKWPISPYGKDKFNQGYWFEVMRRAHEAVEYPQARIELRQRLVHQLLEAARVGKESGVGNESVRQFMEDLIAPVKDSYWRGKWTPELRKVVPQELSLMEYSEELEALAEVVGVDTEPGRETKNKRLAARIKKTFGLDASNGTTTGGLLADAEKQQQMVDILAEVVEENAQDRMYGQMYKERGFAEYMFLPQNQEIILKAHALSEKEREQWIAYNYFILLRSGQNSGMARFNAQAMQGDKKAPASEGGFGTAVRFIHQVMEASGDVGHEDRLKMIGFHNPEHVFHMAELKRDISVRVKERGQLKEIDFELSTMDVLGTFSKREVMSEIRTNKGYGSGSATDAEGKWMKYTMYRKMGYSDKDVRKWLNQDSQYQNLVRQGKHNDAEILRATWNGDELPEVVWSSDISLSDLTDCNSADDLMGNNWGMVMFSNALIDAYRLDYRLFPIDDSTRRGALKNRQDNADMSRKYANRVAPGQLWSIFALHPDLFSLEINYALIKPLQQMAESDLDMSKPEQQAIAKKRLAHIEAVAKYDQISPAGVKTLGMMATGFGFYTPHGETSDERLANFKIKIDSTLPAIESLSIPTFRDFDDWRYVEIPENEITAVWGNHDFTPELISAGLSKQEIERYGYDVVGLNGWKLFLKSANISLYRMRDNAVYKDSSSTMNYPLKAANAASGFLNLLDIKHPAPDNPIGEFALPLSMLVGTESQTQSYSVSRDDVLRREDRMSDSTTAHKKLPAEYNDFATNWLEQWGEVSFLGFANADATHAMHYAALTTAAEANLAYNLDYPIVNIALDDLASDGGALSVARITREQWQSQMSSFFNPTDLKLAEEFLASKGFRFVNTSDREESKAVLVGPNSSYVPDVTTPRSLLNNIVSLSANSTTTGNRFLNISQIALKRLGLRAQGMLDHEYFCWQTLTDNAASMFPVDITAAADSLSVGRRLPNQVIDVFESAIWELVRKHVILNEVFAGAFVIHKKLETGLMADVGVLTGRGRGVDVHVDKPDEPTIEKVAQVIHKKRF